MTLDYDVYDERIRDLGAYDKPIYPGPGLLSGFTLFFLFQVIISTEPLKGH